MKSLPFASTFDEAQSCFLEANNFFMFCLLCIRYNEHKGFYCLTTGQRNGPNCLGRSKGRKYEPMTEDAEEFLRRYYREPNRQLVEVLHRIRQPLPKWLITDVVGLNE